MLFSNSAKPEFNGYGLIIGIGMLACIVIAYFLSKSRGYYEDLILTLVVVCIPLAILGARTYYVVFDEPNAVWTFKKFIGLEDGGLEGLAIYGGVIGGVLGGVIVWIINKLLSRKPKHKDKNVTFLQMADIAFAVLLLGQGLGRWGNFFNQEAYGNLVTDPNLQWFPYAVYIDNIKEWHQATFFYESMIDLLGFAFLLWCYAGKYKSFDGFILSGYCVIYGLARFFIEGLRADSLWLVQDVIRVSQLLSGIIFFFGIGFIIFHIVMARMHKKEPFLFVKVADLDESYYGYKTSAFYRLKNMTEEEKQEMKKKTQKKKKVEFDEVDENDRYWEESENNDNKNDKEVK